MNKVCCPHCGKEIALSASAALLGSIKSEVKAGASRRNGKTGGAPKRDFDYKPKVRVILPDGIISEFIYRRNNHLYWKILSKDKKSIDRFKTDMDGNILKKFELRKKQKST
jgi:hypothetical protein